MRRYVLAALLLFSGIPATGQIAHNPFSNPTPAESGPREAFEDLEDLIHFGDLIEVDVIGSTEFDWRGEITPEGFLEGRQFTESPVFALCKSGEEVADAVRESFSKRIDKPEVRVTILDRSKRPLAVLVGAVRLPQRFRLLSSVSLRQVIVMSGGFTETSRGDIQILRRPGAACTGIPVSGTSPDKSIAELEADTLILTISEMLTGDPDSDPDIFYGDVITVEENLPVYLIGDVARPGSLPFSKGLSVQRAIDTAGGALAESKEIEIRVFRRNPSGTEIIQVQYVASESTDEGDFELREYDIVEVFGGSGKRLDHPPVLGISTDGMIRMDSLPIRIVN